MLKRYFGFVLFIILVFIQDCNEKNTHNISVEALSYLNEALDILESNSIYKQKFDWEDFREDVLNHAENISSVDSTYPVIRYAIKKLGDNHSHFIVDYDSYLNKNETNYPYARLIDDSVAYIHIPGFVGNQFLTREYASRLYGYIQSFAQKNISGWILDLRENTGGNMWPMLAGIGPLLGEDIVGYFIDSEENYISWYCKNGSSYSDGHMICSILGETSQISISDSKVAILIDSTTASSGEAIAVSFKGRANTKYYGKPTRGLSTGNQSFKLSNNAMLILTTTIFADRNKIKYGQSIEPDVLLSNPDKIDKKENDKVILTAMEWIIYNQ